MCLSFSRLLTLVVPLLGSIKIPDDPAERHKLLNLSEHPLTQQQLIVFLQDALLFPYGLTQDMEVPLGMSPYSFKRIASNGWRAEELEEFKKGIVRFLASGVFGDEDVLIPLIVASADTRFSVATPALADLNKICITIDWTKAKLTEPLYVLFSGTANHPVKDKKARPANVRVRQKLLQYLLKCRKSGVHEVRGLQVIFEALFGEQTNQKCKVGALQFCENMIREGERGLIGKLAKVLFDGINKLLANGNDESLDVQNAAYSALSQLLTTCPVIINRDLQLVSRFFKVLTEAPADLQESVKDVLQAMAPAFNHEQNDKATETLLMALLTDMVGTKANIVKKVVITYLTTCFPEHHIAARFVLLLLLEGEEKSSLRELIMTSLYGVPKKDNLELRHLVSELQPLPEVTEGDRVQAVVIKVLPNFSGMASYCHDQVEKRKERLNIKDGIVFPVEIHEEILYYLRICLWVSAQLKAPPQHPNGCQQLKQYVVDNFQKTDGMKHYVSLIKDVLFKRRTFVPLSCLFDVFNSVPEQIESHKMAHDLVAPVLENGLKDVTEDTRSIIGQLYGLVIAYKCPDEEFDGIIQKIVASNGVSLEHQHGSYLGAAYAIQQRVRKLRRENKYDGGGSWKALKDLVLCFMGALKESHPMILSSAIKGISFIAQETELPIPAENAKDMEVDSAAPASKAPVTSKEDLLNGLLKLIAGNSTKQKLREDACDCLASLTFIDAAYFTKPILGRFLKMNRLTKDPAIHIAMGQTIVKIIVGANEILDVFDEEGKVSAKATEKFPDSDLDWLLLELVDLVNRELHPYSRQMACIWLLGIVKSCSQRELIRRRRELLQLAFTELLTEDNELVQDVASRGLGELYSFSDDEEQSELAHSLLEQLTGKPAVKKVTADTKVFEEGTLGKTPTGDSLSTYKDLCALATDMNKPEMIYQFMQLANHNATWNNKLGAAFGLRSISKAAKQNMAPHLVKIVPRLFRYRFDPTPKVQHSMASIWDSLVVNTKDTVDLYYWEILQDLNRNLTSNEWRTRMSCCLGVREIIKLGIRTKRREGSSSTTAASSSAMDVDENDADIEEDLLELWRQLFRVMDDVHEGTRLAAEGTGAQLSKACLIASSSDHGKAGQRIVRTVLPFLLESGVTNIVPEIRRVSLKLVSDLIEGAGEATISQHMVQMVPCLLQATGDSEGNKLSYLSTRYGGQEDVQEAVDNLRAEAAKHQSTTQAMTKCIRYISYPLLEQMTSQILDLMRSSVTLGTKIACAHFICLVSIRLGAEMTPLVAKYVNACTTGLGDRNATVRKYMASSIGHLVGIAKEQTVLKLMQKLQDFYEDRQSSKSLIVPVVIHSINKRYPEVLKDYSAQVLPLIFFAMHEVVMGEDNKATIELWTELWNDVSPGEAGIRMNLDAIVPKLNKYLDDSSWVMKAQAANSIKTLADKLGANLSNAEREGLMRPLLQEMSGRTFDGKEKLMQALASLCKNYEKESDAELTKKIIDAMMRECRKEEPTYRTHALRSTGDILQALEVDRFEEVYNMVWHLLDRSNADSSGESETSAEERSQKATTSLLLRETVCETLGKAWPTNALDTQRKYQLRFVEKCVECLMKNTRPVQLSLLIALGRFLERLKIFEGLTAADNDAATEGAEVKKQKVDDQEVLDQEEILEKICNLVMKCVEDVSSIPHTGLKKESLTIVLILVKKLQKRPNSQKHVKLVKDKLERLLENFRKDHAPEIKCRLLDIEGILKNL